MKKIICINDKDTLMAITEGKIYEVTNENSYDFKIKDDFGRTMWIRKDRFSNFSDTETEVNKVLNSFHLSPFDIEKYKKAREFTINEILTKDFIGQKFMIAGDKNREMLTVKISASSELSLVGCLGVVKPLTSKMLNSKYIKIPTFKSGDIVQNKETMKFYEVVYTTDQGIAFCTNERFVEIPFNIEELKKVDKTTLNQLEYIFRNRLKKEDKCIF